MVELCMPITNLRNLRIENQCNNMLGYIYLTTNIINNKKYIGQRRAFDCSPEIDDYLGSGTILQRAIKLYGKENFTKEILEYCDSIDELNEAEKKWIAYYNAVLSDEFYNIASGGLAGDTWSGRSKEDKDIFREKIRESNKNRVRNPNNISGNNNPAYGKKWCNDGEKNYLLPPEDIVNKGLTLGMIRSEEHNQKISNALKGKNIIMQELKASYAITMEYIINLLMKKTYLIMKTTDGLKV